MISKHIYKGLSVLFIAVATVACSKDYQPSMLTVSKSNVEFATPQASEQTIDVTSNVETWSAFAEASWIKVKKQGHQLIISVDENISINERQADIKILANGLLKAIEVRQVGADRTLEMIPRDCRFDQFGGQSSIYIKSNYQDWTAICDADWIELAPHPERNIIDFVVAENKVDAVRQATITLSTANSAEVTTYTVHQDPILTIIFPSWAFGANSSDIIAFEAKRRGEVLSIPDGFINTATWTFSTVSPLFTRIEYILGDYGYTQAKLIPADTRNFDALVERYVKVMLEMGFVHDAGNIYINPDLNARVTFNTDFFNPSIIFKLEPKQPQDYPTFKEFPYGLLRHGLDDAEVIEAYERAHGGTLLESRSKDTYRFYTVEDNEVPWIYRAYYLSAKSGKKNMALDNINLAVFMYNGEPFLTKEFKELMAKEGFELIRYESSIQWFDFVNKEKGMTLGVHTGKSIIDTRDPVLMFNLTY
ncbi:MAG: BACON domain-containing protein [Bacteroidales bacterium]|uniref:BACON domain-containing protein n=1 Tax=Porphyromonas sp. TaxID=1924944 RepID=UPI0029775474|nr:BACON domain-containing protein [Porphyromonas sp.]MDD7438894.1 BACON domain-containing protein [Bacteroidales bacterium]MDY3067218.1 BACON domain-containing protein [Porphyromonas sp.]